MWHLMRQAALMRHQWYWMIMEGGYPYLWPRHQAMIRAFYGY